MEKSLFEFEPFADNHEINVFVETAKGSGSKFKYEPELGLFSLHKSLPKAWNFLTITDLFLPPWENPVDSAVPSLGMEHGDEPWNSAYGPFYWNFRIDFNSVGLPIGSLLIVLHYALCILRLKSSLHYAVLEAALF